MCSSQLSEQKNYKKLNTGNFSYDDNLKVYIRVRPPLMREKDSSLPFRSIASVSEDKRTISLIEYLGFEFDEASKQKELIDFPNHFLPHPYTFDYIFDMDSTQGEVYKIAAIPSVESLEAGYNSTIFAYGQTGTGKTYTMEGFIYDYLSPKKGLIPRAVEDIFKYIESNSNSDTTFIIRATYLQIYNESIDDLLKPEKMHLSIRESQKKGLYVEGLSEWAVRSPNDIYALLERGSQCRIKASTNMNDVSSRSHAVFTIILEQMKISNGKKRFKTGKLNMVDLAGSERVKISGATGKQLDESRRINKSLSALGNVINALTDPKTKHIPYRDSKLTRLLQNSLGGNCKTSMIAMISPYDGSYNESTSTLNFAKRAKIIRIKASINEEVNQNALISQYEKELSRLRQELSEKNDIINSNAFIKKIEMEKLQAEKDKNEALQALEKASLRFLQEREEKRKLEKKIEIMNFQMIPGGKKVKIEDTPEFKNLLEKHQILLQKDFNEKLNDLEKEKELIQISKEQVDSYSSLLNKQKEKMELLSMNLKEKEDNINHLNDMIDSYEQIIKEQDNLIKIKNQRIIVLENLLIKNNIKFPKEVILKNGNNINLSSNKKNHFKNVKSEKTSSFIDERKKNNNDKIFNNINDENNDINFNQSNPNDEKILIKLSNKSEQDKSKEYYKLSQDSIKKTKYNTISGDNDYNSKKNKIKNIINLTNIKENMNKKKKKELNRNSSKGNNITEIILEKNGNNALEDYDKFDILNNKKNLSKRINNISKTNAKKNIKEINLFDISEIKNQERSSKIGDLSKNNNSTKNNRNNKLKFNDISIKKNNHSDKFKSSKNLDFDNNLYSIESKDQNYFVLKNEDRKKNFLRTGNTLENINRKNRVKTHSKRNNNKMFLKKK